MRIRKKKNVKNLEACFDNWLLPVFLTGWQQADLSASLPLMNSTLGHEVYQPLVVVLLRRHPFRPSQKRALRSKQFLVYVYNYIGISLALSVSRYSFAVARPSGLFCVGLRLSGVLFLPQLLRPEATNTACYVCASRPHK